MATLALLAGCGTPGGRGDVADLTRGGRVLLTVDFEPERTLRYQFVSSRQIRLNWDPDARSARDSVQEYSERLEMVVTYKPVEVDPYGISTIHATVESVKATRSGGPGRRRFAPDAVESAQGQVFPLKIDPRGKVTDSTVLEALIRQMGHKAFQPDTSRGRIKQPDMIGDFVASQWFLWDPVSSIERPAEGVAVGQTWRSQLSMPTPMVMRKARDVTYRLDAVRESDDGPIAVIASVYALAETAPSSWPVPYSGRFQMSGTFGLLGGYRVSVLEGDGEERWNVRAGRLESRRQRYTVQMTASLPPMGIPVNPHVTIDQTLTMELLNP